MICPNCSEEISDSAKVCGYCGHQLKAPPAKCPDCGKDVREGAKVCGYCGHRLIESVPESKMDKANPPAPPKTEPEASATIQEESIPEAGEEEVEAVESHAEPALPVQAAAEDSKETAPAEKPAEEIHEEIYPKEKPAKSPVKKEHRNFPAWAWALIGVIVLGLTGGAFYFIGNRLPKPVTEIVPGAKIVTTENFDSKESENYHSEHAYINDGIAKISGNLGDFLENYITVNEALGVGEGFLLLFKIEPVRNEEWWLIQLYTRKYDEYYASVGFSEWYHPYTDILGEGYDTYFRGVRTSPKHGEWYYAFFAVTDTYVIKVRIWQKGDPSQLSEHTWHLEPELRNRKWIPSFSAHDGNMYIDFFKLISFPVE